MALGSQSFSFRYNYYIIIITCYIYYSIVLTKNNIRISVVSKNKNMITEKK